MWCMIEIGLSGKFICSLKRFLSDPIWPWHLNYRRQLTNINQGYQIPFNQKLSLFKWSMSQIGLSEENIHVCAEKKNFCNVRYTHVAFTFDIQTLFKITGLHSRPFDHKHCVSEVWAILKQGERRYVQYKGFFIILLWPEA